MIKLKVNDLFCGAGGMGLGFKNAGFEIAGAWDFDKYAVQSYKHNVGDHVLQADISEMSQYGKIFKKKGNGDMPQADVWTFGFPCQDLSVAGKGDGLRLECFDCGNDWEIDPLNYNGENICPDCGGVRHKSATRSGLFFEVMRLLHEMKERGLELPKIIMAENVKGLKPYLEVLEQEYKAKGYKMYYALYNSKFWGVPQNRERYFVVGVHESIEKDFVFPEQQELYMTSLESILEDGTDRKYYYPNAKKDRSKARNSGSGIIITGHLDDDRISMRAMREMHDIKGICQTLTTSQGGHREPKFELENGEVKRATPREYARMQGFPDSYEIVVSPTQAKKQFGNAVTVNVAQAIAERIKMFLLSL